MPTAQHQPGRGFSLLLKACQLHTFALDPVVYSLSSQHKFKLTWSIEGRRNLPFFQPLVLHLLVELRKKKNTITLHLCRYWASKAGSSSLNELTSI
jgi:hypothetical protein